MLDFDGTHLIVSEAPIVRKDTVFRITLKASNDDGSRKGVYLLTVNASNSQCSKARSFSSRRSPMTAIA